MAWKRLSYKDLKLEVSFNQKNIQCAPEEIFIKQERLEKAFDLALSLEEEGYNVFVCGPNGVGRSRYTLKRLKEVAEKKPTPPDVCYVHNFKDSYKPVPIILPSGLGKVLAEGIEKALEYLKKRTAKVFESKEYEEELNTISKKLEEEREKIINQMVEEAKTYHLTVLFGPEGIRLMPLFKIEANVSQEELLNNPQIREEYHKNLKAFEPKFREFMRKLKEIDGKFGEEVLKLRTKVAEKLVSEALKEVEEALKEVLKENQPLQNFISSVKKELVKNIQMFIDWEKARGNVPVQSGINKVLNTFRVNVVVDNSELKGAPIVYEKVPTLKGLFGQINYKAEMGVLYADHLSLAAGKLHQANGGFLILNMLELLKNPVLWLLLKRTLLHKKLYFMGGIIEEIPTPHVGILPEPIPFEAKVFLIGDNFLYHLLTTYDDEFKELFKVKAEFNPVVNIDEEVVNCFPKIIKTIIKEHRLKEVSPDGLKEIFKFAVYKADHRKKIKLNFQEILDILTEASAISKNEVLTGEDIKLALKEKVLRVNLLEEKIRELIAEGKIIIDVDGKKTAQVNGLSVYQLGDYSFGRPSRITANVFPGSRGVVHIEREIDMSGPIHTKGVLILSSYFYNKYSTEFPVQFSCTLTFEQGYEPVEGDSASAAELIAILSAVSGVPIKQNFAITGSIDQFGNIQPVGGIKEKVEGFYKTCKALGFTGKQGVILPAKNYENLLLDDEVLEDIKAKKFHIYTVETIDDAIYLLTGVKPESFHKKVHKGLKRLYELSKEKTSTKTKKKK
ncbi:MAG: AAA family ATPase [Thermodesulfobacteria bacterium]|nr:AAA family ATPase [Thermodesulfobacteriota bacterium]